MDKFTFGNSNAATHLADLLTQKRDKELTKYISTHFKNISYHLNNIEIKNFEKTGEMLFSLMKHNLLDIFNKSFILNEKENELAKKLFLNIIVMKLDQKLRGTKKLKGRKGND